MVFLTTSNFALLSLPVKSRGVVGQISIPVFEKTCATTQKNVKSHLFGFWKKC